MHTHTHTVIIFVYSEVCSNEKKLMSRVLLRLQPSLSSVCINMHAHTLLPTAFFALVTALYSPVLCYANFNTITVYLVCIYIYIPTSFVLETLKARWIVQVLCSTTTLPNYWSGSLISTILMLLLREKTACKRILLGRKHELNRIQATLEMVLSWLFFSTHDQSHWIKGMSQMCWEYELT